jgi:hypothetical protein
MEIVVFIPRKKRMFSIGWRRSFTAAKSVAAKKTMKSVNRAGRARLLQNRQNRRFLADNNRKAKPLEMRKLACAFRTRS